MWEQWGHALGQSRRQCPAWGGAQRPISLLVLAVVGAAGATRGQGTVPSPRHHPDAGCGAASWRFHVFGKWLQFC